MPTIISIILFILALVCFISIRQSKQTIDRIKGHYYKKRMNTHLKLVKHFKPGSKTKIINK